VKTRIWMLIVLALSLILCLGAAGCNGSADAEAADEDSAETASDSRDDDGEDGDGDGENDEDKEEAVPVEVADLDLGEIEAVLRYSTNLEAESEVKVFSQAARLVTALLVEEGDYVRRDQVLVRLQDDEQRNSLALITSELANARREYERQKRLFGENLISEQEFNDATFQIEQLEIRLENAERELGYTEVRAPISGTITARMVKLGDQIQVGQHLFDMVDFDSIVARVYVPEKHLPDLAKGQVARVIAPSLGDKEYLGDILRISPVVDPRSGTVKVTVALGAQSGLRPGLYVDVDLVTATHEAALLVPKRAVVYDNDVMFVFRLKNDDEKGERRAERVPLVPVLSDKNFIEPAGGLEAGDQVIIAGQTGLKDGVLVRLPGDEDEESEDAAGAEAADRASL